MPPDPTPRIAFLALDSWAGETLQRVEVVGPPRGDRLRIRAITRTRLAGRDRWLQPGESADVPADAVFFDRRRAPR